jgi:hypothetical protein
MSRPRKNELQSPLTSDIHYTDDEREFLMAIDRYKRTHGRPYPTGAEVLAVLKGLGYRKAEPAGYDFPGQVLA